MKECPRCGAISIYSTTYYFRCGNGHKIVTNRKIWPPKYKPIGLVQSDEKPKMIERTKILNNGTESKDGNKRIIRFM